jgi:Zn-dependent protease with chaperone function
LIARCARALRQPNVRAQQGPTATPFTPTPHAFCYQPALARSQVRLENELPAAAEARPSWGKLMTAEHVYPTGPAAVPADLTRHTQTYRLHAWLAMGGLALFVVLYLGLASWFSWTAYRLILGVIHGADAFRGLIAGVGAAFLAVFMWKALFFVQTRHEVEDVEVTAAEQPRLFAFINRLADEAGAPRAHRVFLSPRVNAAVFYDLTVLNLLFPSRKNLEIGLGLVNALSLGELKAVLAHEFGHFAQRSMAVGRWVYVAQQIAGHIIARRDALDAFLRALSRFDLRVAWVGWLLSLIVWSIRSLMETMFRLVVLAQRALSREMELQADLVAVSLTGSDALIHALHRLHAADEAWSRTLAFADAEARAKRSVSDLFAVQQRITTRLREVLDDPYYGEVAPLPKERPAEHRVFKTSFAQPPRMWSTHPANSEREQNAKRTYIAAGIDARSAWQLFDDVPQLQQQMSAHVFRALEDAASVPLEESLARVDEQYGRAYFDRAYRGAYLGRALTCHARDVAELYGPPLRNDLIAAELDAIYPQSLAENLEQLRALEEEKSALEGLREGFLTAPGGIIRHRGKELRRADLQKAIGKLQAEIEPLRNAVLAHDRRCRSVHLAAATQLGSGWDTYLKGLLHALHYAEHSEANLQDAYGALSNVVSIVTADGRVSGNERQRLLGACAEVHNALRHIYEDEGKFIALDRTLLRRLKTESWQKALGPFGLPLADENNVGDWLQAIGSWVGSARSTLSALRQAALEQLLLVEAQVGRFVRDKLTPGPAPDATVVPAKYPLLLPGTERPRQKKLDLWDRFHAADGAAPTVARLAVACGIIAAVVGVGATFGVTLVNIYNGLARPVTVSIGEDSIRLAPFSHARLEVDDRERHSIRAVTDQGAVIEQFETAISSGSTHSVYNIAGASLLVEWTATYGLGARETPEHMLGPVRWTTTHANLIFEEPPESISTKEDNGMRSVLSAFGHDDPSALLEAVQDAEQRAKLIALHARWDSSDARHTLSWLDLAARDTSFDEILRARLQQQPHDVLTLRAEQDYAGPGMLTVVCGRHRSMARSQPAAIDLQYIAARCIEDEAERDQAFADLYAKSPQHGWLALAVGYAHAQHARWHQAITPLDLARQKVPAMQERLALDTLRVRRMLGDAGQAQTSDLAPQSAILRSYLALESDAGLQPGVGRAYYHLGHGAPEAAVKELAEDDRPDQRVLRLAAASDGAPAEIVAAALALPLAEGIDRDTIWAALALALRERKDPAPYLAVLREYELDGMQQILDFITAVRRSADRAAAEDILDGLDLVMRGHAYSAAVVLEGQRAPESWRRAASQLLFIPERPYFAEAQANDMARAAPDEPGV